MNKTIFIKVDIKAIDYTTDNVVCYTRLTKDTELKQEQAAKLFGILAEEIGDKIEKVNESCISINRMNELVKEKRNENG